MLEEMKKYVWEKPTRKMTMEELWERFEYDPDYVDEDPAYERAIWDRYGNPTYGTLCARYETEHGLTEGPMTLGEFHSWLHDIMSEEDDDSEDAECVRLTHQERLNVI